MFTYLPTSGPNHHTVALVSDRALLLIDSSLSPSAARQLWLSLRELDASELLTELHTVADSGFENYALLTLTPSVSGDTITLAVGGNARAIIDDRAAFVSPGRVATTEARSEDCEQIVITLGNDHAPRVDATTDGLPIASGIVHCSSVVYHPTEAQQSRRAPRYAAPVSESVVRPESAAAPQPDASALTALAAVPAPPTTSSNDWPVPSFEPSPVAQARPTELEPTELAPAEFAPAEPLQAEPAQVEPTPVSPRAADDAQPTNQFDHLFEHTQFFDVEAAAVRPGEPESEAAPQPASPAAPPHVAPARLRFVLPDGDSFALDRPIIVGRRPSLPADAHVNDYHLIKLEDRGGGLSRMHVRLDPHKGGAMVTDLGSTNGTMVATPGSRATELQPQVPHFAKEGDQLRLGNAIVCFLTAETAVSR